MVSIQKCFGNIRKIVGVCYFKALYRIPLQGFPRTCRYSAMNTEHEKRGNVNVWWYPVEFCQSRHGPYQKNGRNSCTLVSLSLANKVCGLNEFVTHAEQLPRRAYEVYSGAINVGNLIYGQLRGTEMLAESDNLSIPDAITAIQRYAPASDALRLREQFYTHLKVSTNVDNYPLTVSVKLTQIMRMALDLKRYPPGTLKHLFAVLIADSRTATFIFELGRGLVIFFDSHQHGRKAGAVTAVASINNVNELTYWFVNMIGEVYQSRPDLYEVSFLCSEKVTLAQISVAGTVIS